MYEMGKFLYRSSKSIIIYDDIIDMSIITRFMKALFMKLRMVCMIWECRRWTEVRTQEPVPYEGRMAFISKNYDGAVRVLGWRFFVARSLEY